MSTLDESSRLLSVKKQEKEGNDMTPLRRRILFGTLLVLLLAGLSPAFRPHHAKSEPFPSDFLFGAATSAYQIEGAIESRGWTVWDTFVRQTPNRSNANVACDHYHRMKQDVTLMKDLNLQAYRFSISWSRILPSGTNKTIRQEGLDFYHQLIDELLEHNITPFVTLFHWDTPEGLEDRFGGWMDERTVQAFVEYARLAFATWGDRVKHWITINEPWTVAVNGYSTGIHAPGKQDATAPYRVAHNLLRAHALATRVYRMEFQTQQKGIIGMAHSGDFRYSAEDNSAAAERAMLFQFGWFVDPIVFGDYPQVMKERLGHRLPTITDDERLLFLSASTDFLGLNYYSSLVASTPEREANYSGYWADIHVDFASKPEWSQNFMGWSVVPDGLREMLLWIHKRYHGPTIYITENGSCEDEPNVNAGIQDEKRRWYVQEHLRACSEAIKEGVKLAGYFVWSLMDNFEWQFGYQRRFGINYVDFKTLGRTPKSSAVFYRDTIGARGRNLAVTTRSKSHRTLIESSRSSRQIPDRALIGYASHKLESVRNAISQGANVIMWSFVDFRASFHSPDSSTSPHRRFLNVKNVVPDTTLDLEAIKIFLRELDLEGHGHVLHMIAVGGWNGKHLDPLVSAKEWYEAFDTHLGDVFDGIDWDLEGNDDMKSIYNTFTFECLDKMGEISRMAHEGGYVVSMAPPQSYLDIHGSADFSRAVNLTDKTRPWHNDFTYFGRNVYAYLLQKYGAWIDLVSLQFYESYSRAAMSILEGGMTPAAYLVAFVEELAFTNCTFQVNFDQDPEANLTVTNVSLPLSKLVLGFANGWASNAGNKTLFVPSTEISSAWESLRAKDLLPRGMMFWIIDEEGTNGVNMSHDLGQILAEACGTSKC
ncbi:beta-glucosidase [Fistulifera solaris]|uniref:Beta-glucosidase n=1 Tax=Fistulifera solaris TaxID=1519565 RepID=A0A1Z5KS61_FISSO|nr:beta-glucosidase [Fistulifera solaris]|eukprot:GAX29160.1 beta-glucosidase [Fistulifera solaris]